MFMCFQSLVLHPYGAALRQHPSIFSMIWVASVRYQMPVRILHAPLQHPIGCLPVNALMICLKSILPHLQLLRRITISPLFLQVSSRDAGITVMSCNRWEQWLCRPLICFRVVLLLQHKHFLSLVLWHHQLPWLCGIGGKWMNEYGSLVERYW